MKCSAISSNVGVEVKDIDLNDAISKQDQQTLQSLLTTTGLLVIRKQNISPEKLIEFTNLFGEIRAYTRSNFELNNYPEILVLSNIVKDGRGVGSPVSGRVWHLDGHYLDEIPKATLLAMKIKQEEGGNTCFSNIQAAWANLPDRVAAMAENLNIIISRVKSREYNYPERGPATEEEIKEWPDVTHPILLSHPDTDRIGLGAGGNVPWDIESLSKSEALPLITFLQEWSVRPEFTYEHIWQEGDILVWDNWTVLHKASPYSGERLLHRTTAF